MFHEDMTDALRGLVAGCGGAKVVGSRIFPDVTPPDAAGRRLMDCLNPDRSHNLTVSQIMLLLKIGRDAGHHGAMHYLTDEVGYTRPSPIDPEDQRAEELRQVKAMGTQLIVLLKRMGVA